MTNIRYETVSYTPEEMAAKEAADRATRARRWLIALAICAAMVLVPFLGCLACTFLSALGQ